MYYNWYNFLKLSASPKVSPRNSPFTSPRGSNQWGRLNEGGFASRRGSRFDTDKETKEQEMERQTLEKEPRQHLSIPKTLESSSSAETLIGFRFISCVTSWYIEMQLDILSISVI